MVMNETFGECLQMLMRIFNLKGSVLAKRINVDSSLIYKWIREERIPSYSSSYIDLIADCLVKGIINSFQQESIAKVLRERGFQISDQEPISILNAVRKCLLEAQGYSIEICSNKTIAKKREVSSKVNNLPNNLDMLSSTNNNVSYQTSADRNNTLELPALSLIDDSPLDSDNVKIIRGGKEILYSTIALLQNAQSKPNSNDGAILIALNSTLDLLLDNEEYIAQWENALLKVLKEGWTVIFLVRLDKDIKDY
jgi:hypothetical protein